MTNWKTTVNGILAFLITTLTTLLAFQVPSAMMNPASSHKLLIATVVANILLGLCRAWVGLLQKDSDKLVTQLPGGAIAPLVEKPKG